MSKQHTYTVPSMTRGEIINLQCAIKQEAIRLYRWRHDVTVSANGSRTHWLQIVRDCISAYRKLQRHEVTL